jgi:hypothetical protein
MATGTNQFQRLNTFFESYAKALENFDTKLMALHYSIPCTFLSDDSATVFSEASKLEGLFNQGTNFYKQYGIAHARPEVWSKRMWTDRIAKAKIEWHYFDKENQPIYSCEYQYVLRMDKKDEWKIELSVSVNEKEKMEEWLKNRK